jgi:hypothetical protein
LPDETPVPTGRVTATAIDLLASIPDRAAGLMITDPPWDIHGGGIFDACCSYDRLSVMDVADILADARRVLKRGAHLYVFATAGPELLQVVSEMEKRGWLFMRLLAWDKARYSGMGAYRNAWEPVLVFANGKPRRTFTKHQAYTSLLRARSIGKRTAKPYELYEVFIEMSSRPGELVVDPFCGTNPLEKAAERVKPERRWLAGDVLTAEQVEYQLRHRTRKGGDWRQVLAQAAPFIPPEAPASTVASPASPGEGARLASPALPNGYAPVAEAGEAGRQGDVGEAGDKKGEAQAGGLP